VASSERSGEASGALNPLRAGHRKRHVAELATECLAKTGLPWERRVYALWLEELAKKKDESLRDQAGHTHAWLPHVPHNECQGSRSRDGPRRLR